ncbi:EbsA family protein [Riemerella anatipestifer]|uniref:EbsA family protein n=1 Tax=Riemerella anatipestifer TaxID=34085 RepID=UPI0030BFF0BF
MKYSYSNKRLYFNLCLGILWTFIGLSYLLDKENVRWSRYISVILGVMYLIIFAYEYFNKYFEISNGKIKVFSVPSKEITISEIKEVKYDANHCVFYTSDRKLKIVKSQINKKQLRDFECFIGQLNDELKKNTAS